MDRDNDYKVSNEETINTSTGLPELSEEEKDKWEKVNTWMFCSLGPIISASIGISIAYLIYHFGQTEKYDLRLESARYYDMQWAFLGTWLFNIFVYWTNMYPMIYKSRIMKGGNLRANMFIFRFATEKNKESSAVVL